MTSSTDYQLQLATTSDIPFLQEIERSASTLFAESPYPELSANDAIDGELYQHHIEQGHMILVAFACHEDSHPEPAGFAFTAPLNDGLHLHELSVHRNHQRRGVGSMLLEAVIDQARSEHYSHVSLTTYRSIAWNGPFYTKHGFYEANHAALPSDLLVILAREITKGANPQDRCIMLCSTKTDPIKP